ncbi:glycosyl hydrolase [Aureitalea sp. L0-47]|uniref:VPS10 domain-containing protein n=1 Tax=Aureitalea sp. L0-47 TaxID=2816962 RepID=UPI0022387A05|nr:glycosyl hydrolase [Aureitalea sp. L0-47]MCW5519442.1 glycosyl hydrolase [Aureitalea sp. L0-47]
MRSFLSLWMAALLILGSFQFANAQEKPEESKNIYNGLELRSLGPAFMSGRIADIDIHPENESIWYVAVGSGGVWKTVNSGTTWTPVFDDQPSYSVGAVTIDPNNPETIWVGSGEDVGGRHVGYGDGVYKSLDGGKSWKNMGLKNSQHISRILVHPFNSDVVWVTAQGPLWSKGGDRGLYKTTDGGENWTRLLGDDEWTGATDIAMDPRDPDVLYVFTWQRHRTVAAYMGGGPGTALYKSTDGGDSWDKLTNGLPSSWLGKCSVAISPQNPDVVYAAIELDRRKGGVYRSDDAGGSWTQMSETVSGGTGPHYYQELYACPHHEGRLYLMDNNLQISEDGGKTFYRMNESNKHGDNHAIAFKQSDPNYLIVGSDGGLYESFDLTKTWKYVENLPVTQYYKMAVDDAEPFYHIYGGTQDNSTQRGPSRTDNVHGIQSSDWSVILNWDGHQPATEPGNPNIVYAERQEGTLSRIDMSTGEVVDIQPQPGENEDYERYNWDAPILVSPHSPTTIFFASQRVWKSTNRGDSWTAISGDLTKNEERITLPIMGKQQSWDAPWDVYAMSNYNTITSLAESPKQQGLIYAGTDDGIIQVTEDGGANWRKIPVGNLPGVPSTAFVNDIKADLFDANTVYVALDNHKYGDFKPYLLKSTDRGRTWTSLAGSIPNRTLVWRLVQDHVKPGLLFIATEFGLYFSVDAGRKWTQLEGGVPTISFRDIAIQRRENDLIGASFGRGFYVLDDYSALRDISEATLNQEAKLFSVRDAWWYVERPHLSFGPGKGSQGDSHFVAPNPDFGATFTYYLKEAPKTMEAQRKDSEKNKNKAAVPFPGWDKLADEVNEVDPMLVFAISDASGNVVRKLHTKPKKGVNRISWDLRYPDLDLVRFDAKMNTSRSGFMAPPGNYSVELFISENGTTRKLDGPVSFTVKSLRENSLPGSSMNEVSSFWRSYESTSKAVSKINADMGKAMKRAKAMQVALARSTAKPGTLDNELNAVIKSLQDLSASYYGNPAKGEIGEKGRPTVGERMFAIYRGIERATYGPTPQHKEQLQIVKKEVNSAEAKLRTAQQQLDNLYSKLQAAGAPYVEN